MQHTVNVIPQWREPARVGTFKATANISFGGTVAGNPIADISDGSDETYVHRYAGTYHGNAYIINKMVLANQIVESIPNNAKDITIGFVFRAMVSTTSNEYRLLNANAPETSGTSVAAVSIFVDHIRELDTITNHTTYLTSSAFTDKASVMSYFSNLTYDDLIFLQYARDYDSNNTLYDTWLQINYSLPQVKIKAEGEWTDGEIKAKVNGEWVDAESVHVKVDGAWIEVN